MTEMELPRLDIATALANIGGDLDLYADIAQIFLEDVVVQLADIDRALAAGDFDAARRAAHTLKGTSGTIGAERLSHCAHVLEQACAAADPAAIAAADPLFRAELAAAVTAVREYLG